MVLYSVNCRYDNMTRHFSAENLFVFQISRDVSIVLTSIFPPRLEKDFLTYVDLLITNIIVKYFKMERLKVLNNYICNSRCTHCCLPNRIVSCHLTEVTNVATGSGIWFLLLSMYLLYCMIEYIWYLFTNIFDICSTFLNHGRQNEGITWCHLIDALQFNKAKKPA